MSDTLPPQDRIPFVIGVTGNTDPVGYSDDTGHNPAAIQEIRAKLRSVFHWVAARDEVNERDQKRKGWLNPATGRFDPDASPPERQTGVDASTPYRDGWRPLGMTDLPILLLTSLAPGIDTLAAEVALECQREGLPIWVRGVLPFPLELYRDCSSFCPKGKEDTWAAKQSRLDAVVGAIRQQPGFDAERDLFCMALDNDLEHDPALALLDTEASRRLRRIRYRAAGEFVAVHSDLLLSLHDEIKDRPRTSADLCDLTDAGTAAIVQAKRMGLTHELLAIQNNFSWADNGPVLHLPIDRGSGDENAPCRRPLYFLHPHETRPAGVLPGEDQHPLWQRRGDRLFRRILEREQRFNQLGINPAKVAGELDNMTKRARKAASPPAEALATESPAEEAARTRLDAEVRAALAPLAPLTRVRRVAADASAREDEKRSQVLKTLTWAIGIAVVTLGLAEDWQPVPGTGSPWVRWIQAGLLGTALLAALVSGLTFWEYRRRGGEEDRHDFRALAEGLRVQFYWCLTGSGHSVSAEYMQRQRNELDWIRYAIASITFPYERWQRRFTAFSKDLRVRLLEIARLDWIGEQHGYFVKKVRELGVTAQGWHLWAWACGAAGLIHVALHFISKLSHPVEAALRGHGMAAGAAMLLAGCLLLPQREKRWILLGVRPQQAAEKSRPRSATFADHVFGSAAIWGGGLMLAGLVMLATHCLGQCLDFFPQWENTWTFFSGLMLVLGGSALAFAERCFLAEHLRQYAAMENLFGCASRRLEELMKHYQTAAPGSEVEQRALLEIQDLLHRVGLEALDENAEWLILHRAKPMEPMMGA